MDGRRELAVTQTQDECTLQNNCMRKWFGKQISAPQLYGSIPIDISPTCQKWMWRHCWIAIHCLLNCEATQWKCCVLQLEIGRLGMLVDTLYLLTQSPVPQKMSANLWMLELNRMPETVIPKRWGCQHQPHRSENSPAVEMTPLTTVMKAVIHPG